MSATPFDAALAGALADLEADYLTGDRTFLDLTEADLHRCLDTCRSRTDTPPEVAAALAWAVRLHWLAHQTQEVTP